MKIALFSAKMEKSCHCFFLIKNYGYEKIAQWWSILIRKPLPDILTISACLYHVCRRRNAPLKAQNAQIWAGGNTGVKQYYLVLSGHSHRQTSLSEQWALDPLKAESRNIIKLIHFIRRKLDINKPTSKSVWPHKIDLTVSETSMFLDRIKMLLNDQL